MKKFSLKSALPLVVAVVGFAGAFTTMSMQKADRASAPATGWVTNNNVPCSLSVQCADTGGVPCRITYPLGAIAHMKSGTQCTTQLFRPAN
jgi:hypothetical protein